MRFERIIFRQHPLIQKKKKKKNEKENVNLIKAPAAYPQIVFFDQNSGSLRLAILRCTSIYTQIGLACSNPSNRRKINLCNSEILCSFSAIVKIENLCSFSVATGDLEAIPSLLFNKKQFRR